METTVRFSEKSKEMKCIYSNHCKYYQKDGYTCNNEEEAHNYCGKYRQFMRETK